ncbi:MAG: ribosome silencing factor [Candidatus Omnitrophica bacterium]|nr:ribosome silencing factor [Candidatus Omnitrophota bacterium]
MRRNSSQSTQDKLLIIAKAALEKKADNIVIMNMKKLSMVCDFFLICSGNTERKVKAIAGSITDDLKKAALKVWHIEGYNEASWVLLDCYDVVIHIFKSELRDFYNLERLWADAPKDMLTEESVKKVKEKPHCFNK